VLGLQPLRSTGHWRIWLLSHACGCGRFCQPGLSTPRAEGLLSWLAVETVPDGRIHAAPPPAPYGNSSVEADAWPKALQARPRSPAGGTPLGATALGLHDPGCGCTTLVCVQTLGVLKTPRVSVSDNAKREQIKASMCSLFAAGWRKASGCLFQVNGALRAGEE
jgi:hypothetical protein